ncbi:CYTH domain-containing protein [Methylobacterium sp. ARG-1]|uniref:CYTH domain-containing protein n=1 Tax=Methylobacterium sp. ARG-1 TaxID=1692501 RepID=UPI0006806889|nr:CYTH domain-containing protein [Methylobacterium sp. ARG-1]KNY19694.1 adenylate cyclase [Methylobacterium sp. ARG-1]
MALEIERKFLATSAVLPCCRSGTLLVQGYLFTDAHHTLRVRRAGDRAFLTWKGPKSGAVREEVECEVPLQMGEALLADVPLNERVQKVRYRVEHAGSIWDVDVFEGALDGLMLAEIEMAHEDELVALPFWLGREVTSDQRYRNSRLAMGAMPNLLAA